MLLSYGDVLGGSAVMQCKNSTPVVMPERQGLTERFFRDLGPGLITGAADDDPSGISTYSVAGAAYGYAGLVDRTFLLSSDGRCATDVCAPGHGYRPWTCGGDQNALSPTGTLVRVRAAHCRERI